jgi:hypothetical protein
MCVTSGLQLQFLHHGIIPVPTSSSCILRLSTRCRSSSLVPPSLHILLVSLLLSPLPHSPRHSFYQICPPSSTNLPPLRCDPAVKNLSWEWSHGRSCPSPRKPSAQCRPYAQAAEVCCNDPVSFLVRRECSVHGCGSDAPTGLGYPVLRSMLKSFTDSRTSQSPAPDSPSKCS